jgi:DNA-binding response OmpR family regulator
MGRACILLVDDEQDLVWAVRRGLSDDGYEVLTAKDGAEGLIVAHRQRPDLIVLDVVMPNLDGLEVCRRLRRDPTLASVPILFLTALSAMGDRIAALDEGGDDYMIKPFSVAELKARIRALLRRSQASAGEANQRLAESEAPLILGPLTLDRHSRQVRMGDKTAQLTPAEFDLLHFLMTHPGELFSGEQVLERVWGYPAETTEPSLARWHMKNLRAKIELDPANPVYICTVPHQGYILKM